MIEIEDVSKQFDRILALDGVSAQRRTAFLAWSGRTGQERVHCCGSSAAYCIRITDRCGSMDIRYGRIQEQRDGFAFWQIRHIFLRMRRRVRWGSITV